MRKRLWKIHSWLGLIAGLGLLVIGLTGSLLVFRSELEWLVHRDLVSVTPTPTGRLSFDDLLLRVQQQLPEHEIGGWEVQTDSPNRADLIWGIKRNTTKWQFATLDPYRGQLLATPRDARATLSGWLLELHYTFFTDHIGMIVTAVFGLLLCALGLTGLVIYREFWKHVFTLRWGRGARLLFSDTHKFFGITSVAFNLVLGFTGAYWNFTHVLGEELAGAPEPAPMTKRLFADALSIDVLLTDAKTRLPGFSAGFISFPTMPDAGITFWGAVEPRGILTGPYGSNLNYHDQTGEHRATTDIRTAPLWQKIVDTFTPLHFGNFGGLPVKIIWALGGLTPGILAVTGALIWFLRRRRSGTTAKTMTKPEILTGTH